MGGEGCDQACASFSALMEQTEFMCGRANAACIHGPWLDLVVCFMLLIPQSCVRCERCEKKSRTSISTGTSIRSYGMEMEMQCNAMENAINVMQRSAV